MSKYNKLWIALAGGVVAILVQLLGQDNVYTQTAVSLLTAWGVYQVPNTK